MKKIILAVCAFIISFSVMAVRNDTPTSRPEKREKLTNGNRSVDTGGGSTGGSSTNSTDYNSCVSACDTSYRTQYANCSRYRTSGEVRACQQAVESSFERCLGLCDPSA